MDNQNIEHIVNCINNTELQHVNFDFLYLENLFPDDFYSELINLTQTEWTPRVFPLFNNREVTSAFGEKFKNTPKRSNHVRGMYTFPATHSTGYTLKPHVDSYPKIMTLAIFLAKDRNHPESGTAIYDVSFKHGWSYNTVYTAPFLPNTGMIFCGMDDLTWHGVDMCKTDLVRNSVVIQWLAEPWAGNKYNNGWQIGVDCDYEI